MAIALKNSLPTIVGKAADPRDVTTTSAEVQDHFAQYRSLAIRVFGECPFLSTHSGSMCISWPMMCWYL